MTAFFSCFKALISAACSAFSLNSKSGTTSASISLSLWYKESAEVSVPNVVIIKSLLPSTNTQQEPDKIRTGSDSDQPNRPVSKPLGFRSPFLHKFHQLTLRLVAIAPSSDFALRPLSDFCMSLISLTTED